MPIANAGIRTLENLEPNELSAQLDEGDGDDDEEEELHWQLVPHWQLAPHWQPALQEEEEEEDLRVARSISLAPAEGTTS